MLYDYSGISDSRLLIAIVICVVFSKVIIPCKAKRYCKGTHIEQWQACSMK